uniref:WGS project CAEQ00000000 data, annotated contig 1108 n=1 Tax=Trypanosoma congolense (strain IL3000) TaxID=1068625 RepID=F9W3T9_TRYCI|nr:unnamed protein product [Trypanosoma congolense IL3000]
MQSVLPYTLDPQRMTGCEKMRVIDPNNSSITGPLAVARALEVVTSGLLDQWEASAASAAIPSAEPDLRTWDLSWTVHEEHWEQNVAQCSAPEEVENLLPAKWFGYNLNSDVDETLAHVCKLCTALVDKFIAWSKNDMANTSTARWRRWQALCERLSAVVELLEESMGEAIPLLRLRDPEFVRECWGRLQEEERMEVVSVLDDNV